ncbi:hypothetical protein ASE94_00030 [Devosia sp. Leaf64]|nr:hypothetical protein ASE94_00030 [Devosia sp. Leaf64]
MPRFYFDTVENGNVYTDTMGTELSSQIEIPKSASRFLAELAQEFLLLHSGEKLALEVRVRDQFHTVLHVSSVIYLAKNNLLDPQ